MNLFDFAAVKAIELSTAHITSADSRCLTLLAADYVDAKGEPPYIFDTSHGFVILIGAVTVAKIKVAGVSQALSTLLDTALDEGLLILAFDQDASCHDEIPHFNW